MTGMGLGSAASYKITFVGGILGNQEGFRYFLAFGEPRQLMLFASIPQSNGLLQTPERKDTQTLPVLEYLYKYCSHEVYYFGRVHDSDINSLS